jgi:hypothetical protein
MIGVAILVGAAIGCVVILADTLVFSGPRSLRRVALGALTGAGIVGLLFLLMGDRFGGGGETQTGAEQGAGEATESGDRALPEAGTGVGVNRVAPANTACFWRQDPRRFCGVRGDWSGCFELTALAGVVCHSEISGGRAQHCRPPGVDRADSGLGAALGGEVLRACKVHGITVAEQSDTCWCDRNE